MSKIKKILKKTATVILILTVIAFWTDTIIYYFFYESFEELFTYEDAEGYCNVANIQLHGLLLTHVIEFEGEEANDIFPILSNQVSSQDIVRALEEAEEDDSIKAVILEIDSSGGSAVADEEIANALKRAKKPTVALIRAFGNSSAYYAATGADIIFASKDSDIGSIGVSMSYLDNVAKNQKEGLTYNQLSLGKFKDISDPDKPLTNEEKKLLMRNLEIMHENFIKAVAENRDLDLEKVRQLADGSSMLGEMALERGLIDRIGGLYEVKEYLKEIIGEEVEVCW